MTMDPPAKRQRVTDFFVPVSAQGASAKGPTSINWRQEGTVLIGQAEQTTPSSHIAAFDMDDTLITTKSGKKFATNSADWRFLFPEVKTKLRALHADNVCIVVISNQLGVRSGKVSPKDLKTKAENISFTLGIPMHFIFLLEKDEFRKPLPSSWLQAIRLNKKDVCLSNSYYVGDAAGRLQGWQKGKKKDFSCSDRKFANNVGIAFHTPEAFFLGQPETSAWEWGGFDPTEFSQMKDQPLYEPELPAMVAPSQEVVLMHGCPASGKSHFATKHLSSYSYINRDILKTGPKCEAAARQELSAGKSIVIDNTFPSKNSRKVYVDMATSKGIPVRLFKMSSSIDLAKHCNVIRGLRGGARVPDMAYNMFKKNLEHPSLLEGFTEIKTINFVPNFESDEATKEMNYRL